GLVPERPPPGRGRLDAGAPRPPAVGAVSSGRSAAVPFLRGVRGFRARAKYAARPDVLGEEAVAAHPRSTPVWSSRHDPDRAAEPEPGRRDERRGAGRRGEARAVLPRRGLRYCLLRPAPPVERRGAAAGGDSVREPAGPLPGDAGPDDERRAARGGRRRGGDVRLARRQGAGGDRGRRTPPGIPRAPGLRGL